MILRTLLIMSCIFLSGCAPIKLESEGRQHALNVQFDGKPWKRATYPENPPISESKHKPVTNFTEQLTEIKNLPDYKNSDQVMIFIHGGLNTLTNNNKIKIPATIKAIKERNEEILANREKPNNKETRKTIYPIFINWHSRFCTWVDRMGRVRDGRINPWKAIPTIPLAFVIDAGRTIGRAPYAYFKEGASTLSNIRPKSLRKVNNIPAGWNEQTNIYIDQSNPDSLGRIPYGIGQVFPGALRLGTIPLADFVLYESYQMMLRRIDMLFRTENDYKNVADKTKPSADGALSQLMKKLLAEDDDKNKKEIILIGHSMGTIAVNEIIRRYPHVEFKKVIYMAAACTSKDFMDTIPPYLQLREDKIAACEEIKKQINCDKLNIATCKDIKDKIECGEIKTDFYSLSLHPFADQDESTGFYTLPNGSLLEWLDTYVHRVKTPLDLTFGKWNNAMNVLPLLNLSDNLKKHIHIKGFPVKETKYEIEEDGHLFREKGYPIKHGDFRKFHYWNPDFWDPKKGGPYKLIKKEKK